MIDFEQMLAGLEGKCRFCGAITPDERLHLWAVWAQENALAQWNTEQDIQWEIDNGLHDCETDVELMPVELAHELQGYLQ